MGKSKNIANLLSGTGKIDSEDIEVGAVVSNTYLNTSLSTKVSETHTGNVSITGDVTVSSMTKTNQPMFVGTLDTQSSTSSAYVANVTETYNTNMSFNASTDRITVPTTGYYMIHAQQLMLSSSWAYFWARKNGVSFMHAHANPCSWRDMVVTGMVYLNVNDYIEFYVSMDTSITTYGGGHSMCYIQLVQ
tara:strand:- start:759 stop:1328 length:570 start_codon:yes stop_codon:yes gene_type:complete